MNKIRKNIRNMLLTLSDADIYENERPDKKGLPCVIYNFTINDLDESTQIIILDLNIYDDNQDTTNLDRIASDFDMKSLTWTTEDIGIFLSRNGREDNMPDKNPKIHRRLISYEGKLYEK